MGIAIKFITKNTNDELKEFGIYEIECLISGKKYIGSTTTSFRERWGEHRKRLINDTHLNPHLLNAWKKYGEDSFEYRILKTLNHNQKENILKYEQQFIDSYEFNQLYNICPIAGNTYGVKNTEKEILQKSKRYIFISPENKFYDVTNMRKFCREYNLKQSHIVSVANGKEPQWKGWLVYKFEDFNKEKLVNDRIKMFPKFYFLSDSHNNQYITDNLKEFSIVHNLSLSCLYNTLIGDRGRRQHKGWTIKEI